MENRYLTLAEAAKEVSNKLGQYVDQSFIKMLCERKEISSSCIPARDARKNDIFMIHEGQIDKICMALKGEDQMVEVKKEEKPMGTSTEKFDTLEPGIKYLTTTEAAECLGVRRESVASLITGGYLPAKKIENKERKGGHDYIYMIAEKDVEERMEHVANKRQRIQQSRSIDIPKPKNTEPAPEQNFSPEFYERLDRMKAESAKMHEQLDSVISKTNELVAQSVLLKSKIVPDKPEIDIAQLRMEAYKEGFKEGFKAAMEVK